MTASEIIARIRDNVQLYDINPLKDGFEDDPDNGREGLAILPWVQQVQRDLAQLGCYYGVRRFTLEEGQREVCTDGSLLHVYQVTAEDEAGQIRVLEPFSRFREDMLRPRRYSDGNRRINRYDFFGMQMSFDHAADQDYIISILTDSLYTPLTESEQEPAEVDEVLHDVFVWGGSYYVSTQALNMPQNRNEFAFQRAGRYERAYREKKAICVEVARSRMINESQPVAVRGYRF